MDNNTPADQKRANEINEARRAYAEAYMACEEARRRLLRLVFNMPELEQEAAPVQQA